MLGAVKPIKVTGSWLADEFHIDQLRLLQAEAQEGTGAAAVLGEADAAVGEEIALPSRQHGDIDTILARMLKTTRAFLKGEHHSGQAKDPLGKRRKFLNPDKLPEEGTSTASSPKPVIEDLGSLQASVIIPAFGKPRLLSKCLKSLEQQNRDRFCVVVVDDASPAPLLPEANLSRVFFLRLEKNRGPGAAINVGVKFTRGDYVILLNSDTFPSRNFIEALVRHMEETPSCHFGAAKLVHPNGELDGAGDAMLLGGGCYRVGHGLRDSSDYGAPRLVLGACAAGAIYRRQVIEALGGFDDDFVGYLDDVDLSLRAHLVGYSGMYIPTATATHVGSGTFGENPDLVLRLITRNQIWLVIKNFPAGVLLRIWPRVLLFQLLWAARLIWQGKSKSYLLGLWEAFRGLPRMLSKRRQVQQSRKLTQQQFGALLRDSERDIAAWHARLPADKRSKLLSIYFQLFSQAKNPLSAETRF